jgi:TetR/AcrR family transcriptional regulator, cholesterol catabolism regulator
MPPRVNADARRRQLAAQAAELFDETGYHTTSVAELARAAGMRKPTLYHYFSSKDDILFWIHEEFIDLLLEKQGNRRSSSAGQALLEVMTDVLELMRSHRGHVRVFFEHHRELAPEHQATIREKRVAYQERVEGIVRRGIAEGEFRAVDPRLATLGVFGMCNWAYQWYRTDGPLEPREIAECFFELLFNGLRRTDA